MHWFYTGLGFAKVLRSSWSSAVVRVEIFASSSTNPWGTELSPQWQCARCQARDSKLSQPKDPITVFVWVMYHSYWCLNIIKSPTNSGILSFRRFSRNYAKYPRGFGDIQQMLRIAEFIKTTLCLLWRYGKVRECQNLFSYLYNCLWF